MEQGSLTKGEGSSTIGLLEQTSLDRLLLILKTQLTFIQIKLHLLGGPMYLSLSLQLEFPGWSQLLSDFKKCRVKLNIFIFLSKFKHLHPLFKYFHNLSTLMGSIKTFLLGCITKSYLEY